MKRENNEDSTVGVGTADVLKFNFNTSKPGDKQNNLTDYVDQMKEGQNDISDITGESITVVSSLFEENPRKKGHEENLRNQGYEVPYMAEPMDECAVYQFKESDGAKLNPTTKEGLNLGDVDEKKIPEKLKAEPKPPTKLMKHTLADKIEAVTVSDRIVDSPCVPTTSEYGWSAKMGRIMETQGLRDNSMTSHMVSKKTTEVNPTRSIMMELKSRHNLHGHLQQQQQRECSKPQPTKKSTRQERGRERKEEERDQEGRKEEERKVEERGKQVEEDVAGWTEVTRKKRKKMVQIFVKVNGSKTSPLEVSLTDDRVEDVMRQIQKGEDVYVTMHGKVLRRDEKLKSCEVTDGCTVEVTSRMRGGGKHKDKKGKEEKKKQVAQLDDGMCAMACEQMRQVMENLKTLADDSTGEDKRRVVENVEELRMAIIGLRKQARGDELQRVAELEESLKKMEEEMLLWSVEEQEQRRKEEQQRQEEQEHAVMRKGKGKGNGGKGEHASRKGRFGRKGAVKMVNGDDEGEEADEEKGGTRNLRWADCEEEGARQGAAEGEWHKSRKEQGIMWLDGGDEEWEGHGGSTGGERCEVCGRVEVWSEESEEQEERGGQGGKGARQKMPSEEDEEDERTVVAPNTGAGGSHPRAMTDPEGEVKEEEVTGEEMADEKLPGLEVVKSKQEEQEEEEQEEVKSEQEVQEEQRRKQEAREEARALEAREEAEESAGGARGAEESAGGARGAEESTGGARGAEKSAGGARRAEESARGARGGEESAGGARGAEKSAEGARKEKESSGRARKSGERGQGSGGARKRSECSRGAKRPRERS